MQLSGVGLDSKTPGMAFHVKFPGAFLNCHSPTQPQHELEHDLIMGRKQPTHPPTTTKELLRHFQASNEADFRYANIFLLNKENYEDKNWGHLTLMAVLTMVRS